MRIGALILGACIAIAVAAPAQAYRYRTCNGIPLKLTSNNLVVHSANNSFPAGYWLTGLDNAVSQFNKNPSNFYYTRVTDFGGVGLNNGESEIWGSTNASILQGFPAIAYSYWQCYWVFGTTAYMTEGDVIFDYNNTVADPFEWTVTRSKTALFNYTGTGRLLQGTAIHEFGHALGLLHVNTTYNVMGSDFSHVHTNGSVTDGYIGENAGDGTVFLYGLWASGPQDVAVEHWRYLGASGEYSTHARVRLYNSVGALLPSFTVNGEGGYVVRRGQVVRAEFTYENVGRATVFSIPVYYYISTNDIISTGDRLIGSVAMSLARDVVFDYNQPLTIPANLALNTNYWLGAVVNPTASVAESDRSNNASYIPIRVVP